ncbi:uncharacterized protein ARMOST_04631 [Armillaria ostoyae]|uniref:CCHC-type domain-containing protein n=1 Tax=Armillaria ostoyae TaxID=47428 RepID=A0A284QXV6_ARMOS|nr:uncharacterized protein ARMOST_04631 [Armillaria ostoyae]
MIANIGIGILIGYKQWKEHIVTMNEERQCKQAINLISGMYQPQPQQSKPNAGMPKGASGTTTSLTPKKTVTSTTFGGRGQPMDIDTIKSGNCFRCGQKGHISKNCPLQSWNKGKQEVRASTTEPSTGSKIEEGGLVRIMLLFLIRHIQYYSLKVPRINPTKNHTIVSIASSDEDGDVTKSSMTMTTQEEQHHHQSHSPTHDDRDSARQYSIKVTQGALNDSTAGASKGSPSATDNHLTSNKPSWHVKVPGDKPPIIVVPIITVSVEP